MGRGASGATQQQVAGAPRSSASALRGANSPDATVKARIRTAVGQALGCVCEDGDLYGDLPDFYHPRGSEVSLCVELLGETLSITRISCEPQGQGLGRRAVAAIREVAATQHLRLEAPDPFESSLGFWKRCSGHDVGDGERIIMRLYTPPADSPNAVSLPRIAL